MDTIANHAERDNSATLQAEKSMGIILGPHRVNGTWEHVAAMARNGYAVIRDGRDVRLIWSESFETGAAQ